ncbi:MAG TPA: RHS repeat-associated core domain-containing protein [Polyangiaceae bacterium]|nr:RHS repeat-associated core domain-containing protein [Polyangiaceae bacterium]
MNPAIVIAGGGGAGGGSGPGGGGAGAGNEGAGTGKGNGDPDGGDKSGEDCGAGGNGGCSNCGSQIAKGDPVDIATGEVFTLPAIDFELPGRFNFQLVRSYSTRDKHIDRGLGWGWAHCLDWELRREGGRIRVTSGMGHDETFITPEPGGVTDAGPWYLRSQGDNYVLRAGSEFRHHFAPDEADPDHFRLIMVSYRKRGIIGLHYEGGRLATAIDSVGRYINFVRDREGRVTSIEVPPPEGPARIFARFRYDHEGSLVEAIDADGNSTTYAYDAQHRLLQYRHATGLTFHFRYDREGRCVETWGDYPGGTDPALASNVPEFLADGETRAKGIYHIKLEFGDDGYRESIDSVRLQRFFTNAKGLVDKGVDALGNATERTFDKAGNVTSQTDRLGGTSRYTYDQFGNLTSETDVEGRTYAFEYGSDARLEKMTDPAGNSINLHYNADGELEYVEDLRGGVVFNQLDEHGQVLAQVHENGGRTEFEYDAHANCVQRRDPNGDVFRYVYDWWGNRLEKHAPNGRVTQSTYAPSGKLVHARDSMGREKRWEYDGMGNCVAIQTPDKYWTRFFYGGFRWLCCTTHPDGTSAQRRYNREGWLVEQQNERGERYVIGHDPNGLPSEELTYDGRQCRAGYDAMTRMVWFEEDDDRTEFERSPMGLLLAKSKRSGAEQRFRYDVRGKLVAAENAQVSFEWTRDPGGALLSEAQKNPSAKYRLEYQLDRAGNCVKLQTSEGLALDYIRDARGDVQAIRAQGESIIEMRRSPEGTPVEFTLPGRAAIVDDVDQWDRVERRRIAREEEPKPSLEPEWLGTASPGTFRVYQWDPMDQLAMDSSGETTTTYEYDARQFLRAKRVAPTGEAEEFRFDELGAPFESGQSDVPRRDYAPGGLLERRGNVEYQYDKRHRLVEKRELESEQAARVWRFEWDDWDMLSAVETPRGMRAEYLYDAFARRMQKKVFRLDRLDEGAPQHTLLWRTDYLWAKASLLQEIDYDADAARTRTRSYLYEEAGDYLPLGHRDNDGPWRYYFADPNGTPEEILDACGKVLGRLRRKAYGRTEVLNGSTDTTQIRFPGQYEDPETGLHYNRYRYYDPDTGRYLSPDPIGIDGGNDLFAYGPNPISWFDPIGWEHYMRITKATKADGRTPLVADVTDDSQGVRLQGMTVRSGTVDDHQMLSRETLKADSSTHTERKLMHALGGVKEGDLEGAQVELEGEFPPCRQCHRAMHHFAEKNGMDMKYSWRGADGKMKSVTYPVSGEGQKQGDGDAAKLLRSYDLQEREKPLPTKLSEDDIRRQRDAAKHHSLATPEKDADGKSEYDRQCAAIEESRKSWTPPRPIKDDYDAQKNAGKPSL